MNFNFAVAQEDLQEHLARICRRYGVKSLRAFGSVARGKATERIDIDLLVEFNQPVGFFALIRLEKELGQLFGRKVDLVTERALSPYLRSSILSMAQRLYEST